MPNLQGPSLELSALESARQHSVVFGNFRHFPITIIYRHFFIYLTGSCNNEGFPLVIFPAEGHALLDEQYSAQELEELVSFYMGTVRQAARRKHGFTFLADLRSTSKEVIGKIVETLERLQVRSGFDSCICLMFLPYLGLFVTSQ